MDAALDLQKRGHRVTIFTAHHDRRACFNETRDGSLDIRVHGDFLPAHLGQRLRAPCAIVRTVFLACAAALRDRFDLIFVDLVPHAIPLLRLFSRAKIVYYCHFPDLFLTQRRSFLYRLYRAPIDRLEEIGIGGADCVLVNSRFTVSEFRRAFPRLGSVMPNVLYPGVEITPYDNKGCREDAANDGSTPGDEGDIILLSIQRFERKKNVGLALEAMALLRGRLRAETWARTKLVIAGGHDGRWRENREVLSELRTTARNLDLRDHVLFKPSFSDEERMDLLSRCLCVVYTPEREHFGLVPIETMAAGRPVVAVNSGGPVETIRHGETGFLCQPTPDAFADALARLILDPDLRVRMGWVGREHVAEHFSRGAFGTRLEGIVRDLMEIR